MTWRGGQVDFEQMIERKRRARMDRIDAMEPDLRKVVNEYGLMVVQTLLDHGVTKPRAIRHVVEMILDEFSPSRGSHSIQGIRKNVDTGGVDP